MNLRLNVSARILFGLWLTPYMCTFGCMNDSEPKTTSQLDNAVTLRIKHNDHTVRNILIYTSDDKKLIRRFAEFFSRKDDSFERSDWAADISVFFIKPNGKARAIYINYIDDLWSDGGQRDWLLPVEFRTEFEKFRKSEKKRAVEWDGGDRTNPDPPLED